MNTHPPQRVVCVIECPAADALLKQHCATENKSWRIPFDDLMNVVAASMEGNQRAAYFMLEEAIGMPLFHPAHYGRDDFSEPAVELVEALALAIKHALPKVHPNKENIIVHCRFLQVTGKWFVFDVVVQEPPTVGAPDTVIHF